MEVSRLSRQFSLLLLLNGPEIWQIKYCAYLTLFVSTVSKKLMDEWMHLVIHRQLLWHSGNEYGLVFIVDQVQLWSPFYVLPYALIVPKKKINNFFPLILTNSNKMKNQYNEGFLHKGNQWPLTSASVRPGEDQLSNWANQLLSKLVDTIKNKSAPSWRPGLTLALEGRNIWLGEEIYHVSIRVWWANRTGGHSAPFDLVCQDYLFVLYEIQAWLMSTFYITVATRQYSQNHVQIVLGK